LSKKLVGGILGSVLLMTLAGVYFFMASQSNPSSDTDSIKNKNEISETAGADSDRGQANSPVTTINPFESKVKTPLKEEYIQQYIHAMSHQKVSADEKWSYFEITDSRIDFLLNQLEINNYEYERLYKDILTSWKEGDFSDSVSHHNDVWKLQNGTIGIATGLLSPEEEEAFKQEWEKESR
jgi:Family of unknown function (DUF6241)